MKIMIIDFVYVKLVKCCSIQYLFSPVQNHKLQRAEGHLLQVTFFGSNYDNF